MKAGKVSRKIAIKNLPKMSKIIILPLMMIVVCTKHISASPEIYFKTEIIKVSELYTMMVSPDMFNWTSSVVEQFR